MTRVATTPERLATALASGDVTELELNVPRGGSFDVDRFVVTAHLDRIRFLAIDDRIDPESFETLINCDALRSLERLTVWSIRSPKCGGILAQSKLRSLRYLDLCCGVIGKHGLAELVASPVVAKLEVLELAQCKVDGQALAKLAASMKLGKLVQLSLGENAMTSAGLKVHAGARFAKTLRRLNLWTNKIDAIGLPALARFSRLERLNLSGNKLRDASLLVLARSLPPTLEYLALGPVRLTPKGLRAFAVAAKLPKLQTLDLEHIAGAETVVDELRAALPSLLSVMTGTPDRSMPFPDTAEWWV